MQKQLFIIVLMFLGSFEFIAQNLNSSITIKKTKWNITISPANDSVLWIDIENKLTINVEGGTNYCVDIRDGRIRNKGKNYVIQVFTEGSATLTVCELLPNNKKKVIFTKLYEIKKIPEPIPYVCDVKRDSVIDKLQIIYGNIVKVIHPFYKEQLPVLGFDVIFSFAENPDTLRSFDNHFTQDMKRRLYYLNSGSVLNFENVYCLMPDGKIHKLQPFVIYINETDNYKVGLSMQGSRK